jgi:hypothetical protein
MKPEKVIMSMKITSVVLASASLIYSAIFGNFIWGIVFGAGCLLFSAVAVRMYRTDFLGELDDE